MKKEKRLKDPQGGLTAPGRADFKRRQGADLRPGVKGPADIARQKTNSGRK
jgi:Domain of unknown function (DUF6321)